MVPAGQEDVHFTHTDLSLALFQDRKSHGVQVALVDVVPAAHPWPGGQLLVHGTHGFRSKNSWYVSEGHTSGWESVVVVPITNWDPGCTPWNTVHGVHTTLPSVFLYVAAGHTLDLKSACPKGKV